MDTKAFSTVMVFMAGVLAGYLAHPLIDYFIYWIVYKAGNKLLNWLYEKGWIK